MTNNLIPFSIEKWREGYQPVTREGIEVKELTYFETCNSGYPLVGTVNQLRYCWDKDGIEDRNHFPCEFDIMLKPKTKKVYIGIAKNIYNSKSFETTRAYLSEGKAIEGACGKDFRVYELEIEVE